MRRWLFNFAPIAVAIIAFFIAGSPALYADSPSTRPASAPQVTFFAMGDWGEDTTGQRKVAAAMAKRAKNPADRPTAVMLCGDNFYFRLTGVEDPLWKTLFEQMYDPAALDMPFFASLGNHDYDGDNLRIEMEYAREHPQSRFKLPGAWYRRDFPRDAPLLTLIVLDSNRDDQTELQWSRQIAWLKEQLASPRAPWTICCAHHPMFSNGYVFFNGILQRDWGKLFEQGHVDFYLTGHEHNLQHLEIPGWNESFLIAGGGGAHQHPLFRADRGFSREDFGFVEFQIEPDRARVRFIDAEGKILHEFERSKAGKVRVVETTPNSPPQKNALQAYLELRNRTSSTQPAQH
ncbi:MAG TPA: metallophosphoesterase [Tepidisphaeraceae bacterium]|nr:metallophosphoesterase [Tepidisphaeraceae bacterium]